jgi:hypothetical protein
VPDEVKTELRNALVKCQLETVASKYLNFILLFAKSLTLLGVELLSAAKILTPAGILWISWPKRSCGVATDITEDVIRQRGLAAGLVDVKVCAVTDVWSGLKFVIPVKNRPKWK